MFVYIMGRENRHALVSGKVIFCFNNPSLVILFIWVFWALQKIIFEQLFIVDRLGGVQKDNRLLHYLILITRLAEIFFVYQVPETLDAVEPSWSLENQLKTG